MSPTLLVWLLGALCVVAALLLIFLAHRYEQQMLADKKPRRRGHVPGPIERSSSR